MAVIAPILATFQQITRDQDAGLFVLQVPLPKAIGGDGRLETQASSSDAAIVAEEAEPGRGAAAVVAGQPDSPVRPTATTKGDNQDAERVSTAASEEREPALAEREWAPAPDRQNPSPMEIVQDASEVEQAISLPMGDKYHSQLTETHSRNACGPTSLLMVLDYFGLEQSLDTVILRQDLPPLQGGYDPTCVANPVCMSPDALLKTAREDYRLNAVAHEAWTFEEIYNALASGQPIIADVSWRLARRGPGHFVVIYGIDMQRKEVYYHDPYDGPGMVTSWEKFEASWAGPVDVNDPLQPQGHSNWAMSLSMP